MQPKMEVEGLSCFESMVFKTPDEIQFPSAVPGML